MVPLLAHATNGSSDSERKEATTPPKQFNDSQKSDESTQTSQIASAANVTANAMLTAIRLMVREASGSLLQERAPAKQ